MLEQAKYVDQPATRSRRGQADLDNTAHAYAAAVGGIGNDGVVAGFPNPGVRIGVYMPIFCVMLSAAATGV